MATALTRRLRRCSHVHKPLSASPIVMATGPDRLPKISRKVTVSPMLRGRGDLAIDASLHQNLRIAGLATVHLETLGEALTCFSDEDEQVLVRDGHDVDFLTTRFASEKISDVSFRDEERPR
jgi:hypothetical protein